MSSAPQLGKYKGPQGGYPDFLSTDPQKIQDLSIEGDKQSYAASDFNFANGRYGNLKNAQDKYLAGTDASAWQLGNSQGRQYSMENLGTDALYNRMTQNPNSQYAGAVGQAGMNLMGDNPQLNQFTNSAFGAQQSALERSQNPLSDNLKALSTDAGQRLKGDQPIDPMVQQEMQRSGLMKAATALGAMNLGQGEAGTAAAARQLGISTMDYLNLRHQQAVQETATSEQLNNEARQTAQNAVSQASNTYFGGLGQQLNRTLSGSGLLGQSQQMGEQYQQDTQNLLGAQNALVNQNNAARQGTLDDASQMFTPRQYGIGGQGFASIALNNDANQNARNYAAWQSLVNEAALRANEQSQQGSLNAQASNANTQAGVSAGAAVATASATAASAACGIARAVYGTSQPHWKRFRFWLMNRAHAGVRRAYLKLIPWLAPLINENPWMRDALKTVMDPIVRDPLNAQLSFQV